MSDCLCGQKYPWWQRQIILLMKRGFIVGVVLAVIISWEKYHSVKYSLFCGLCGWLYVAFPSLYDKAWMA